MKKLFILLFIILFGITSCVKKHPDVIKTDTVTKFYRIRQIDKNGNVQYSKIIKVTE